MRSVALEILISAMALCGLTGCEPPPIPMEVTQAKGVLDAAAQAGAAERAPQLFQEAQSLHRQATEAYSSRNLEEAKELAGLAHTKALSAASQARASKMKEEIEAANQEIMASLKAKEEAESQEETYQVQVLRMERILKAEHENEQKDAEVALRDAKDALDRAKSHMADQFAKETFAEATGLYNQADEALRNENWKAAIEIAAQALAAADKADKLSAEDFKKQSVKKDQKDRHEKLFNEVAKIEGIETRRDKTGVVMVIWKLFQTGAEEVDPAREHLLDTIAHILTAYPSYQVVIEGHTDNTGSKAINLALSSARAQSVKDYFVHKKNLPTGRFTATGYGSAKPMASNDDPKGREKNRRVEIVLLYSE